ncbi:MAG TPA: hypothetical protein DHU96_22000 [Actinobacteria bacterium]|nr:hypothetical protein [Actinomycetota bacterium]
MADSFRRKPGTAIGGRDEALVSAAGRTRKQHKGHHVSLSRAERAPRYRRSGRLRVLRATR